MPKFVLAGVAAMLLVILSLGDAAAQNNQLLTNQFYEAAAGLLGYSNSMKDVADLIIAELDEEVPDFNYIDELWDYNPNFFEPDPYLLSLDNLSIRLYYMIEDDRDLQDAWEAALDDDPTLIGAALEAAYDRWQKWEEVVAALEDIKDEIVALDEAMGAAGYSNLYGDPDTALLNVGFYLNDAEEARDAAKDFYFDLLAISGADIDVGSTLVSM
jgi:hypothetical protein